MPVAAPKNRAIILIGMPGAGKSTLGVVLAKTLAMPFVDTDILIQERAGCSLQAYLDAHGYAALRDLEAEVLLENDFSGQVVATGGSAVYSRAAMEKLATMGLRVYLKISLDTLITRVHNQDQRGLACAPGTSLSSLFEERKDLYEAYADLVMGLDGKSFDHSLSQLIELIGK